MVPKYTPMSSDTSPILRTYRTFPQPRKSPVLLSCQSPPPPAKPTQAISVLLFNHHRLVLPVLVLQMGSLSVWFPSLHLTLLIFIHVIAWLGTVPFDCCLLFHRMHRLIYPFSCIFLVSGCYEYTCYPYSPTDLCGHMFSFLLSKYLRLESLSHKVDINSIYKKMPDLFPRWLVSLLWLL